MNKPIGSLAPTSWALYGIATSDLFQGGRRALALQNLPKNLRTSNFGFRRPFSGHVLGDPLGDAQQHGSQWYIHRCVPTAHLRVILGPDIIIRNKRNAAQT